MSARVVRLRNGKFAIQRKDYYSLWLKWRTSPVDWESENACRQYCDQLNSASVEWPTDPVEVVYPERKPL